MRTRSIQSRIVAALGALVAVFAISLAPSPARANFPFAPVESSFLSLLPDTCIPVGTSGYCITFTNATYSSILGMMQGQDEMGSMLSQQMTQNNTSNLARQFGISDTNGTLAMNLMYTAATGTVTQSTMAYAAANAITANTQQQKTDLQNWINAIDGQNGQLQATQVQGQVNLAQLSAQQQQTQLDAFKLQQEQQQNQFAIVAAGDLLDLTSTADPTAGWNP